MKGGFEVPDFKMPGMPGNGKKGGSKKLVGGGEKVVNAERALAEAIKEMASAEQAASINSENASLLNWADTARANVKIAKKALEDAVKEEDEGTPAADPPDTPECAGKDKKGGSNKLVGGGRTQLEVEGPDSSGKYSVAIISNDAAVPAADPEAAVPAAVPAADPDAANSDGSATLTKDDLEGGGKRRKRKTAAKKSKKSKKSKKGSTRKARKGRK